MRRLGLWCSFTVFFLKELVVANLRVARDVLRRTPQIEPAFVAVPIDLKSEFSVAVLANTITLTPGTLSVDYDPNKKTLYIHTMYLDGSKEKFKEGIKNNFEARVKELFE